MQAEAGVGPATAGREPAAGAVERWMDARRRFVAASLFALALGLVGLTLTDPGITWDEPAYFGSAQLQVDWVRTLLQTPDAALDRETVFAAWDWDHYHNPHPPVYKEAMAITWWAARGVVGDLAAHRLAPALLFAGLVALVFRWGAAAWGGVAGAGAALLLLLMPRIFGHAHVGATETPLIAFWTGAAAAGWWAIERDRPRAWLLVGLAWGLAAGTKFTGLLAVAPLVAWALWRRPRSVLHGLPLAAGAAIVVFFALNPMLWFDAPLFLRRWFWESLHRSEFLPIATWYLGRLYEFAVPWHHTIVLTAATVPLGTLSMAGIGVASGIRRADPLAILSLVQIAFLWLLMLSPGAPHHDGVRMFIPLFPFLALLAGYGFRACWLVAARGARALLVALVLIPAAVQLAIVHPYQLAYYSELVGGVRGARALGFETTYWMDAYNEPVLDWMNANLPRGTRVWVLGEPLVLRLHQAYGDLRSDIDVDGRLEDSDWALVMMRQGLLGPELLERMARARPAFALELQGVPLVAIYPVQRTESEETSRP